MFILFLTYRQGVLPAGEGGEAHHEKVHEHGFKHIVDYEAKREEERLGKEQEQKDDNNNRKDEP